MLPSPDEMAEMAAHRVVIEQAKGVLMVIYHVDADRAFELLKWRSHQANFKLGSLARQLVDELPMLTDDHRLPKREGYDQVLLRAHQRVAPNHPTLTQAYQIQ